MEASEPNLSELRRDVAATITETLGRFASLEEIFAGDTEPEDLEAIQDEALDDALVLSQLSRIATELVYERADDEAAEELHELLPLLHSFAESYILIGLASDWDELREQPLITGRLLDRLLTAHMIELLGEGAAEADAAVTSEEG